MDKLKVLLVDDMPIDLRHFKGMLSSDNGIYEVVGSASNGRHALQYIHKLKPDLVISDVEMPVMDGLKLAKILKEEYPLIKLVLLTAYAEFSYIHQGMNLGVYAYLVKNAVTKESLEALISQVYEEKQAEEAARRVKLEKNIKSYLESSNKEVEIDLGCSSYNFLLIQVITRRPVKLNTIREGWIDLPMEQTEEIARTDGIFCKIALQMSSETGIILLFVEKVLYGKEYQSQKQDIISKIRNVFEERKIPVFLLISERLNDIQDVPQAWQKQKRCEPYVYVDEPFQLQSITAFAQKNEDKYRYYKLKEQLLTNITEENIEIMGEIYRAGRQCFSINQYIGELNFFAYSFIQLGEKLHLLESQEWKKEQECLFQTVGAAEKWITEIWRKCIQADRKSKQVQYSAVVLKFLDFVQKEYCSQITSDEYCDHLNISTNHFRRVFKKEMGITPMVYLNRYRIEIAKRMLKEEGYKIQEISESVGFTSSQYFSSVFKKYTGVSPQQYRQQKGKDCIESINSR